MKIVNKKLLDWFRQQRCELCGCIGPSEPHHIHCRGMGGGSRLDVAINLVSLCSRCHRDVQGNAALESAVCRLAVEREVWLLQRAPKDFQKKCAIALDFVEQLRYD